ncbi:MAG: phosphatidylglycerophosphatase A [Thermodesulfovibrionales bacterium]|nr:phosphatidylglycerophosphatase A [Thermodesulfovibrionales bacterium]
MKRNSLFRHIATLGPVGYLPVAPGTWGSLAALAAYIAVKPSIFLHVLAVLLILPVGIAASSSAEKSLDQKDSRHIVIDEACGFLVAVLLLPFSIGYTFAAFFLFRVFDILKPFPVRKAETALSGGLGVMADDVVAGIYANLILQIWNLIFF